MVRSKTTINSSSFVFSCCKIRCRFFFGAARDVYGRGRYGALQLSVINAGGGMWRLPFARSAEAFPSIKSRKSRCLHIRQSCVISRFLPVIYLLLLFEIPLAVLSGSGCAMPMYKYPMRGTEYKSTLRNPCRCLSPSCEGVTNCRVNTLYVCRFEM